MLEGHLSKLSIGYEALADHYEEREGKRVRVLDRIRLWETSVVVFPMNPLAVAAAKGAPVGAAPDLCLAIAVSQAEVDLLLL